MAAKRFDGIESLFDRESGASCLAPELRRPFEQMLDCDLSTVRVAVEPRLIGARVDACVRAETILISPAVPDSRSPDGTALLGHEIAHVLQHRSGQAVRQAHDPVLHDPGLEIEADRIGLHCAAILHPHRIADPGLPATVATVRARHVRDCEAPVQLQMTSSESFDDFAGFAWSCYNQPLWRELSVANILSRYVDFAQTYNPHHVSPKQALAGSSLYSAMQGILGATEERNLAIRMQDWGRWPDLTRDRPELRRYYSDKSGPQAEFPRDIPELAEKLATRYLHVYRGPTIDATDPPGSAQIAFNVVPHDMERAVGRFIHLLEEHAWIHHLKFLSPGNAFNPESVIIYADSGAPEFATFHRRAHDALTSSERLTVQDRAAAMYDDRGCGVSVGSEPPLPWIDFVTYRASIMLLTQIHHARTPNSFSLDSFRASLHGVMRLFGIDTAKPHLQGPLATESPHFSDWWKALEILVRHTMLPEGRSHCE
ncbi:MAG: DUF4157 domain-containing protein [Rhizomicrobium sp.]